MAHALDESIRVKLECSAFLLWGRDAQTSRNRTLLLHTPALMRLRVGPAKHHLAWDEVTCPGTQKSRLEEKWLPWSFLASQSHFLSRQPSWSGDVSW